MKRQALWLAILALALAAPVSAETRTYFGFQIGVSNAPPPPTFVFRAQPEVVFEPSSRVYIVEDAPFGDDMFRYGGWWYVCTDNGWWYRSRSYRGPFRAVDVRMVPERVFTVPAGNWKHHWSNRSHDRNDVAWGPKWRNRGNGHGRGHGH